MGLFGNFPQMADNKFSIQKRNDFHIKDSSHKKDRYLIFDLEHKWSHVPPCRKPWTPPWSRPRSRCLGSPWKAFYQLGPKSDPPRHKPDKLIETYWAISVLIYLPNQLLENKRIKVYDWWPFSPLPARSDQRKLQEHSFKFFPWWAAPPFLELGLLHFLCFFYFCDMQ